MTPGTQGELDLQFPSDMSDVFHFSDAQTNFNDLAQVEDGFDYWFASDVMRSLGYSSFDPGHTAIQRAIQSCTALNIEILDNFTQETRTLDGSTVRDYRLSRFACYLVVMNADPKKPQVARAQSFFAVLAETFRRYVEDHQEIQRILDRDEITQAEKSLSSTARQHGVDNFGFFQNAGYRGMYNMNMSQLKAIRGIDKNRSPLDFMGPEESAANRFRITQTEARIKNENARGQRKLEGIANVVGRKVRQTMEELSGTRPEQLPKYEDIRKVKSAVKSSSKDFAKLDKPPRT